MTMISNQENAHEDTRQRIITAAMQLFGRVGYARATTRAIADEAGVNEVTLFRHFGSKKNLLMACIEAFNAAGFAATFETELTGDYAEDLMHMAQRQIRDTTKSMDLLRLLFCDARTVPELREAMLSGGRSNLDRLSRYFQRRIDEGVVRPDIPAEVLASAFDSLFSSNIIFENMFQNNLSPRLAAKETIQPLVDLFVQGTRVVNERNP